MQVVTHFLNFAVVIGLLALVSNKTLTIDQAVILGPILIGLVVGSNIGSAGYSINRGVAKTAPVTITREIHPINEPSKPSPAVVKIIEERASALRQAIINAEISGIDIDSFMKTNRKKEIEQ